MKKLFVLFFVLLSIPVMAKQSSDTNTQDNRTWLSETYKDEFLYPVTAGVYGAVFFPFLNGYDIGGGFTLRGKVSLFKWLAIALDVGYNHTSISEKVSNELSTVSIDKNYDTFEITPTIVFQRETPRGQAGINPWLGVGLSFNASSYNFSSTNGKATAKASGNLPDNPYLAFVLNAGVNYNFSNNVYAGVRADLAFANAEWLSGFKLGLEAGYRF